MNIISWNCRGLGILQLVRALTKLVRVEALLLIFLVGIKAKVPNMARLQTKLDYTLGIIVPSDGKSGGLALLWKALMSGHTNTQTYILMWLSLIPRQTCDGELLNSIATRIHRRGTCLGSYNASTHN